MHTYMYKVCYYITIDQINMVIKINTQQNPIEMYVMMHFEHIIIYITNLWNW